MKSGMAIVGICVKTMMQGEKRFIIVEDDGDPSKSDVENRLSTINVSWLFPCCSKSAASAVEKQRVTLLQVPTLDQNAIWGDDRGTGKL
jgi:hypothetical protein